MPTRIVRDHLGRAEIVGSGPLVGESVVGLIFDKALDVGTYTKPVPTKYRTVVYQQRQKRITGTKFWDEVNDFTEDTEAEAERKAKEYISGKKWTLVPGGPGVV